MATANDAHASLAAEGGALDAVNSAVAELSRMAAVDRKLGDIADALSDACISLEDCANELRTYRDGVAFDPRELARMRERYSDLKALLRQWGPTMDDVFAMRDRSQELLSLVDDGDERIKKAREALGCAERELFAAAKRLNACGIPQPLAFATRLAVRWRAWRWATPSSFGSRAIFRVPNGRWRGLRAMSFCIAVVPD